MADQEPRRLMLPSRGIADKTTFVDNPLEFAPPPLLRNIIPLAGSEQRRMGTRFGTTSMYGGQTFGNGNPVQQFLSAERLSGESGVVPGALANIDGVSREAGALAGHCFIVDPVGSMYMALGDARAINGLSAAVAWHPTLRRVVFLTYYLPGGATKVVTGVSMYDIDTMAQVWQAVVGSEFLGVDSYANHVSIGATYTFVSSGSRVWIFNTATGVAAANPSYNMAGWSNEVMCSLISSDGNYLTCVFTGAGRTTGRTFPNTPTPTLLPDLSWATSGAMKFRITGTDAAPLEQMAFGDGYDSSHAFYEIGANGLPHGYLRFSEQLERSPRGCWPFSASLDADDNLVVGFTNKGWGWIDDAGHYADDASTHYRNVAKFDSSGALIWEADANSRRVPYTGDIGHGAFTYHNDIPQSDLDDDFRHDVADFTAPYSGTPKPSANAIATDSEGNVYVAGQRSEITASGTNVYKLDAASGNIIWGVDVGAVVEQHAICVDPTDDNLWVAVMMNAQWTGVTGGKQVILLKLSNATGAVLFSFNLTPTLTIVGNTAANPTVVTTSTEHGLTTGDLIAVPDNNGSSATIKTVGIAAHTVTVLGGSITGVTIHATAPEFTTSAAHNLVTGDIVRLSGTNCTPTRDGEWTATVTAADKFTIASVTTGVGNAGTWYAPKKFTIPINCGGGAGTGGTCVRVGNALGYWGVYGAWSVSVNERGDVAFTTRYVT